MNYKKYLHTIAKVIFSLTLLMGVLGLLSLFGLIPGPTRELYNTDIAFTFIQTITASGYISLGIGIASIFSLIALWTRREGLAALIILPVTVNIIGFHAFLDGGVFTSGSIAADIFFLLNLYFLYVNRGTLKLLLKKN
jgi:hypothetical protein